jgi:hypothetical protein
LYIDLRLYFQIILEALSCIEGARSFKITVLYGASCKKEKRKEGGLFLD